MFLYRPVSLALFSFEQNYFLHICYIPYMAKGKPLTGLLITFSVEIVSLLKCGTSFPDLSLNYWLLFWFQLFVLNLSGHWWTGYGNLGELHAPGMDGRWLKHWAAERLSLGTETRSRGGFLGLAGRLRWRWRLVGLADRSGSLVWVEITDVSGWIRSSRQGLHDDCKKWRWVEGSFKLRGKLRKLTRCSFLPYLMSKAWCCCITSVFPNHDP